jgi:hypothetical protein
MRRMTMRAYEQPTMIAIGSFEEVIGLTALDRGR